MKVYRVIPESFLTISRWNNDKLGLENVFNENGYVTFDYTNNHEYNNYYANLKDKKVGKYFFLFAEDAISYGHGLLSTYHQFFFPYFLVSEYDIPVETIIKHIGTGKYESDEILECFVEKDDFDGTPYNANSFATEERVDFFVNSINNTLERILELPKELRDSKAIEAFINRIGGNIDIDGNIDIVADCQNKIRETIRENKPASYSNIERELVKTDYLTKKIFSVNMDYLDFYLKNFENVEKYYKEKGIDVDYSEDREDYKEKIIRNLHDEERLKKYLLKK